MANLKSSKKDIRRTERRTLMNKAFARNAKMLPRKVRKLVLAGQTKEAEEIVPETFKALDKAVKKNVLHKNTAARTKSRLTKLFAKK